MKAKLTLNGHRPPVERCGEKLIVTLTDVTGSIVDVEMDMTEGGYIGNDINEIVSEYWEERLLIKEARQSK